MKIFYTKIFHENKFESRSKGYGSITSLSVKRKLQRKPRISSHPGIDTYRELRKIRVGRVGEGGEWLQVSGVCQESGWILSFQLSMKVNERTRAGYYHLTPGDSSIGTQT